MPKGVKGFQKGHVNFSDYRFPEGNIPWNKDAKGVQTNTGKTHFKKGQVSWNKGKKFPKFAEEQLGEKNPGWKGDNAKVAAMHYWVTRWKGKPEKCEKCGKIGEYQTYFKLGNHIKKWTIEWSNIDHTYKRVLDDYAGLCSKCHHEKDRVLRKNN